MGQSLYRTDVFVDKDTDEIAPDIRNHDDGEQIGHRLTIPDMRAFNVEAARLQPLEHSPYLPSPAVHLECFLGVAVRDKDLQLRLPVLVFNLGARQVAGLSVDIVDTIKMLSFTQSHVVEQPERPGLLAVLTTLKFSRILM